MYQWTTFSITYQTINFSFVFYCYENNSLLYFYCNWQKNLVQVSYRACEYTMIEVRRDINVIPGRQEEIKLSNVEHQLLQQAQWLGRRETC